MKRPEAQFVCLAAAMPNIIKGIKFGSYRYESIFLIKLNSAVHSTDSADSSIVARHWFIRRT